MSILKPNIPLKYVKPDGTTQSEYPLTSIDQVIDEDGIHRLNQTIVRADLSDVEEGQVVLTNSDLLENHPAIYYATSEGLNTKANKSEVYSAIEELNTAIANINPLIAYPIGSVYFSVNDTNPSTILGGGTWELIGSKLAVRENVFGNGKSLALTSDGSSVGTLGYGANTVMYGSKIYGGNIGSTPNWGFSSGGDKNTGVPTKANLGSNPQNSGLIVDTETIYSWKRTA